jgi:MoxR-like ATPase
LNEYLFIKDIAEKLTLNIHEIIVGMDEAIRSLLIGLLVEGHILLEGAPGTAKTYLARVFSNSLGLEFKRVQFTADLMPSDITGSIVYNRVAGALEFRPGPIFANVVLADEINRASPRSQSALLECMQEKQVTVVEKVADLKDILKAIELTSRVYVDKSILEYIVKLGQQTRKREEILLGVSPRGQVSLLYASKAAAALEGKPYVTPDHVKSVVNLVFNHRIILRSRSSNPITLRRETMEVLREIIEEVEPPR